MNCFQKLLSSWWRTTNTSSFFVGNMLWIAFKNYYLRDEGQQIYLPKLPNTRCELLSKIIIFVMKDNSLPKRVIYPAVVNCFQKLLSSWWRTTGILKGVLDPVLWIAFKNYYLRDEGQQGDGTWMETASCELLSKIIIFVMKDNINSLEC